VLLPAPVVAQNTAAAGPTSSDAGGFHGWQLEGHIGGTFAGTPTGTGTLPAPPGSFTTFQGLPSRFVPSWYFGDGALLANHVAQAIVNEPPPPITPLDPVLTTASGSWQTGLGVGVRIGHAITRHALGEFNLDTSRGHMAISSSAPCWGWKPSKLGHEIPVKAHTSAMTTEECSTSIEWLPIWA